MGNNIYEWKFDILQTESAKRHKDIYNSAIEDASLIYTSRDSMKSEIIIKDILRPSLMSMTIMGNYLRSADVVKVDVEGFKTSELLREIFSDENNKYLLCKVSGDSMIDEGIIDDDMLLVDREEKNFDNRIIVAYLNDILFVKRYRIINGQQFLFSGNSKYKPYLIEVKNNFKVLGVVKLIMKSVD